MGKDARVTAVFGPERDEGRLQYEPPRLLFRGRERRTYQGQDLAGVRADAGDLVLGDGARFALGEKQAAAWADAILNPKSRLDKLGVKPGQRIAVLNLEDAAFATDLSGPVTPLPAGEGDLDLLFYGADSEAELAAVETLIPRLAPRGALWVVSLKGPAARVKDLDVFRILRPLGLVDTKVCAFSETRTALRFVRRSLPARQRPSL